MNRSKLIIGILVGTIALASFSVSSSIAWYASSAAVSVEGLELEVSTGPDLLISGNRDDLDSFTKKLVVSALDSKDKPFFPVSSMMSSNWLGEDAPKFYEYRGALANYNGIPTGLYESIEGYFSHPLYILADMDCYVSLSPEKCFIDSLSEANRRAIESGEVENLEGYSKEELLSRLNTLEKAMRVSFYDKEDYITQFAIFDPHKEGETYYGGILDNDKNKYYDIYTDSERNHREIVYGEIINRDKIVYGPRLEEKIEAVGEYTSFNATHDIGTYPFDLEASLANGMEIAKEESHLFDETASDYISSNPEDRLLEVFSSDYLRFSAGQIEEEKLRAKIPTEEANDFIFVYNGTDWTYEGETIDLSEYGLRPRLVPGESYREGDSLIVRVSIPNPFVIKCHANVPKAVYVSFYLEGWDLDCVNASMGGHFAANIDFRVISSMNRPY